MKINLDKKPAAQDFHDLNSEFPGDGNVDPFFIPPTIAHGDRHELFSGATSHRPAVPPMATQNRGVLKHLIGDPKNIPRNLVQLRGGHTVAELKKFLELLSFDRKDFFQQRGNTYRSPKDQARWNGRAT